MATKKKTKKTASKKPAKKATKAKTKKKSARKPNAAFMSPMKPSAALAEIIGEKCFENLHQEIPFGLAVKIIRFNESDGPVIKLHSEILVAKDNHRPIVIGQAGQILKKIGTEARKEIEKLVGRKVYLDLKVASKRGWQKNPGMMKELGYVLPKS